MKLYFGVLHPVARGALSRLSGKKPSFATTVRGIYCIIPQPLHVLAFTGHHQVEHKI
jgi:hypothetical protein